MQPVWINECAFADDIVIFARNETELKRNLNTWNNKLSSKNLKINENKTKIMINGKSEEMVNIEINDQIIEQVNSFKYLGVQIESQGHQNQEITARVQSAANLYHSIKNTFLGKKEVSLKTKISVFNSVFVPILTFGSESWVLTKRQESLIQAVEMKYLRKVLGVTRMNKLRNSHIREQLKVQPVLTTIENCQLRWYGHLKRLNKERPVRRVWEAKRQEKRKKGRPATTWDQNVAKLLKTRGIGCAEAASMALDKKKWQNFIYGK